MIRQRSIELPIKSISKEGFGVGQTSTPDGQQFEVAVPFTLPGDTVKALLLRKRRGKYESRLEEVLTPSPERIAARCIHFTSCGGCRWQHMKYEQQLALKETWIRGTFAAHLTPDVQWHPIIPCNPPWNYRNKMELSFSSDRAGNRYLGLIMQGSKGRVFQMKECHLGPTWFAEAARVVQKWWDESGLDAYHCNKDTGSLRTLTVRDGLRTGDRMVMLTVSGNAQFALQRAQLDTFVAFLRDAIEPLNPDQQLSIFMRIQQTAKGSPTQFYEMLLYGPDHIREKLFIQNAGENSSHAMTFKISPTAFFQPNTLQAEKLYSRALQLAEIPEQALVYDLYCGTGTLGICAAKHAKHVVGIELVPEAVLDARENAKQNGLSNVTIHQGDVGKVLAGLEANGKPDVVLVDPPRMGLDQKAMEQLLSIGAETLVYVSCNPTTQAANLDVLLKGGYKLTAVQPVDQFPHTVHVENIVILKRSF